MKITNEQFMTKHDTQLPQYTILAQSFETYSSWGHIVYVSNAYRTIGYAKINYINRTWERYQYQSAILQAIHNALDDRIDQLKNYNNIKRLTKTKKQELITNDTTYNELKQLEDIYKK